MEAAKTLEQALERMSFSIESGRFVLVGTEESVDTAQLGALREPLQWTREGGETTVLCREEELARVTEGLGAFRVERDLLWVRFESAMDWEVVGFLARVTTALAEAGVPIGAVCGFSRDHLFVGARFEAVTRSVLAGLFGGR